MLLGRNWTKLMYVCVMFVYECNTCFYHGGIVGFVLCFVENMMEDVVGL